MEVGTRVRMSKQLKDKLRRNGSGAHVREFGSCEGVVQGEVGWGGHTPPGPHVDVRWQPSNLLYAYHPDDLEQVRGKG